MKKLKELMGPFFPLIVIVVIVLVIWGMQNLKMDSITEWMSESWKEIIIAYSLGVFSTLFTKRKSKKDEDDN